MHAQFLHQFAFAGDAVQIADQQNAQQELGDLAKHHLELKAEA